MEREYKALPLAGTGPTTGRQVATQEEAPWEPVDQEYEDQQRQTNRMQAGMLATMVLWVVVVLGLMFLLSSCAALPAGFIPSPKTATTAATSEPAADATPTPSPAPSITPTLGLAWCKVQGTGGERLNVRREPNMKAEILTSLRAGEKVTVIAWSGDWLAVEYGEIDGYIYDDFCKGGQE